MQNRSIQGSKCKGPEAGTVSSVLSEECQRRQDSWSPVSECMVLRMLEMWTRARRSHSRG